MLRVNRSRVPDVSSSSALGGPVLNTVTVGRSGASSADLDGLFDEHYERLVRSLSVAAGSREVARDAVQHAFVKAYVDWRRIGGYDDPVGWIRRVALNRISDHHRGRGRSARLLGRLPRHLDDDDQTVGVVDRVDLGQAIRRLPERQRFAVSLYYLEGLSVQETAAAMGVSVGSVKTHLSRARATLKPALEVS
jgi:RNA polymerase sigma-70 factor, ECF subfamily